MVNCLIDTFPAFEKLKKHAKAPLVVYFIDGTSKAKLSDIINALSFLLNANCDRIIIPFIIPPEEALKICRLGKGVEIVMVSTDCEEGCTVVTVVEIGKDCAIKVTDESITPYKTISEWLYGVFLGDSGSGLRA